MITREIFLTESYISINVRQENNLYVRGANEANLKIGGIVLEAPRDLLQYSPYLKYALNDVMDKLLMINWAGTHVYVLDLASKALADVLQLARDDDDDIGLYNLSLHSLSNGIAITYEGGLAVFNEEFVFLWQDTFDQLYDWLFDRIEDGVIWYCNDAKLTQGYVALDGRKVSA